MFITLPGGEQVRCLDICRHHDDSSSYKWRGTRYTACLASQVLALQWRHNERGGISNHRLFYCLLYRLFRRKSKKTSKLCSSALLAFRRKYFHSLTSSWDICRHHDSTSSTLYMGRHLIYSMPGELAAATPYPTSPFKFQPKISGSYYKESLIHLNGGSIHFLQEHTYRLLHCPRSFWYTFP